MLDFDVTDQDVRPVNAKAALSTGTKPPLAGPHDSFMVADVARPVSPKSEPPTTGTHVDLGFIDGVYELAKILERPILKDGAKFLVGVWQLGE